MYIVHLLCLSTFTWHESAAPLCGRCAGHLDSDHGRTTMTITNFVQTFVSSLRVVVTVAVVLLLLLLSCCCYYSFAILRVSFSFRFISFNCSARAAVRRFALDPVRLQKSRMKHKLQPDSDSDSDSDSQKRPSLSLNEAQDKSQLVMLPTLLGGALSSAGHISSCGCLTCLTIVDSRCKSARQSPLHVPLLTCPHARRSKSGSSGCEYEQKFVAIKAICVRCHCCCHICCSCCCQCRWLSGKFSVL